MKNKLPRLPYSFWSWLFLAYASHECSSNYERINEGYEYGISSDAFEATYPEEAMKDSLSFFNKENEAEQTLLLKGFLKMQSNKIEQMKKDSMIVADYLVSQALK